MCNVAAVPLAEGEGCTAVLSSLKLTARFVAGVKKVFAFGFAAFAPFAWVAGGLGSSTKSLHSESRCLLILCSFTGFSQMGHANIDGEMG